MAKRNLSPCSEKWSEEWLLCRFATGFIARLSTSARTIRLKLAIVRTPRCIPGGGVAISLAVHHPTSCIILPQRQSIPTVTSRDILSFPSRIFQRPAGCAVPGKLKPLRHDNCRAPGLNPGSWPGHQWLVFSAIWYWASGTISGCIRPVSWCKFMPSGTITPAGISYPDCEQCDCS